MPESSLLETTAEVSVAFAGFISIFLVLVARDGRFPAEDSLAIRTIVACAVLPVFYAVLPLILYTVDLSESTVWRISSSIAGLVGVAITGYFITHIRALPLADRPSQTELRNYYAWLLTTISLACHLANALAWPWAPSGGVYIIAVWLGVAIAGANFVVIKFRRVL